MSKTDIAISNRFIFFDGINRKRAASTAIRCTTAVCATIWLIDIGSRPSSQEKIGSICVFDHTTVYASQRFKDNSYLRLMISELVRKQRVMLNFIIKKYTWPRKAMSTGFGMIQKLGWSIIDIFARRKQPFRIEKMSAGNWLLCFGRSECQWKNTRGGIHCQKQWHLHQL